MATDYNAYHWSSAATTATTTARQPLYYDEPAPMGHSGSSFVPYRPVILQDVLLLIRDYINRSNTVDDLLQLADRMDFLYKSIEINPLISLEHFESILNLSTREFVLFKKGIEEHFSELRDNAKQEKKILDDKLFEVE